MPVSVSSAVIRAGAGELSSTSQTLISRQVVSVGMAEVGLAGWDVRAAALRTELARAGAGEREWPTEIVSSVHAKARAYD